MPAQSSDASRGGAPAAARGGGGRAPPEGGATGKGSTITGVPNADQGWGRVDLGAVLDATSRELYDQVDLLTGPGDSVTRSYAVQDAGKPVKVTLAWTDAPGLPDTDAFANDLDLAVEFGETVLVTRMAAWADTVRKVLA